ncbi:MAG: Coenzyme F420 hydrogenase/dehydrogenase, beta subunit C-terminal domain [Selenomonadaceae bacterium]|nr:Coenzyme F420 hydrogenase/dehydrogenase, beta subunit C-terminal domain [Selenomonadaceae bacterium]
MKIENMISENRADCTGCEACSNACPKNCITMRRDDEGFAYPKIHHEICIQCGKCDATCPALNFQSTMPDKLPEVFVAIHPDEKIRRHSSSGGMFTALSEIILRDGGIIFGAGFNENWQVVHTSAENFDELENLRGSKYVQSEIGEVYRRVKVELEKDRKVLFSGTPCHCAGLKNFLGKDYPNLLTVDVICHGTPSPMLWEKYLDYLAQGHEIARVNFRSKRFGWANNHLEINFYDCGFYAQANFQDNFVNQFLNGIIERPSCHECKFKFPNGKSDVTIGDAWGVQNFAPNMFDNRGTSLVILHTDKGKDFFRQTEMVTQQISFDIVMQTNPMFLTSSIPDDRRQKFFDDVKNFPNVPIAVMKKYFFESPQQISTSGRNFQLEVVEKYVAILQHLAARREKNFLLITSTLNGDLFGAIQKNFLNGDEEIGVYVLHSQVGDRIEFFDCLHPNLSYTVMPSVENLLKTFKDFHITEIFIDRQLPMDEGSKNFLANCGLPIRTFELKAEENL